MTDRDRPPSRRSLEPHAGGSADVDSAAAEPVAADRSGRVETHGIDVIPERERHGRPWELFPVWFTGNLTFIYLLFGGILIQLGLGLSTALILAVVFNAAWICVGVIAIGGPRTGTASLVISRAQYGFQGNKLSSFFNWIIQVGYEGVNIAIAAFAVVSLADFAGWHMNTAAKLIAVLLISAVVFTLGVYGHATIVSFQKAMSWALGGLTLLFLIFLLPHVHWSYRPEGSLRGTALTAAVLVGVSVVLSGPLSYPIGADYSRYLPRNTSPRAVALFTAVGGYVPSMLLMVTGVLAATVVDPTDFTTSIRHVVPGWFYPVYLLVIVFGLIANSIYSVYSSGLTLQALGVPLRRSRTVWIDAAVGGAIAVYGVLISNNFLETLQNALLWSIFWLAPFFGIYMVELLHSRGRYDGAELSDSQGRYRFNRGFRWGGVTALLVGMVCSALLAQTPYLKGPISQHLLHGGDLSAVGGFVIAAVVYWLLCLRPERRAKRAEL